MPCTKPRPGLLADIKFNPANGSRAELDAKGVMARLENEGATRRWAFRRPGGERLFAVYCAAHPEWAARAEMLLAKNAEAARWRKVTVKSQKGPADKIHRSPGCRSPML
jgi:hypothetical protein